MKSVSSRRFSGILGRAMPKPKLAAAYLMAAHEKRERFTPLPAELAPRTAEEAYAIQDSYVALRAEKLGAIAGYKIALSSPEMQRFVGVDSPQAGVMLASTLQRSPARVRAADYVRLIVEFEIAAQMAADLPAVDAPFTRQSVAEYVAAVMPAIEIADDRNADYSRLAQHPLELIADNGWNEGAGRGAPVENWRARDRAALHGLATIKGDVVGEGMGAAGMGHPVEATAGVATHFPADDRPL